MGSTYTYETGAHPKLCLVWMHGLGADAENMLGLAKALPSIGVELRHVFLSAPMRAVTLNGGMVMPAWYDITGLDISAREDEPGILASENDIKHVIDSEIARGFSPSQILLCGFSQGGAMALFAGLRYESPLGGVVALSGYLPLARLCLPCQKVPVFMASGTYDDIVADAWTKQCAAFLQSNGLQGISYHEYPMGHEVTLEELQDLAKWLHLRAENLDKRCGVHQ